jgi:SAM-dependent methyltransferase
MSSVHIPYETAPTKWFEYEQFWKVAGLELLAKYATPTKEGAVSVLDFGSGRGEFLKLLKDAGYICEGADFDPECVRLGSQYAPTRQLSEQDLETAIPEKSFDVVSSFHVLEHVLNPSLAVRNFKRISRRYLLLVVPNLQSTNYLCLRRTYEVNAGHAHGWDYPTFHNFLTNICGLDVLEMAPDVVPFTTKISRLDAFLERVLGRAVIRQWETGYLKRKFPYLSNSIMALCRVRDHGDVE